MQSRINDEIIKSVLIDDNYSRMTGEQIDNICSKVQKGDKQDSCYDQLDGTRSSGKSKSVTDGYWKAVSKGYKGTISEFEKRKNSLSKLFGLGLDTLNVFSGLGRNPSEEETVSTPTPQGMSVGAKIGVGLGIAGAVFLTIYLINRN